jgi:hypothetical protein
LLGGKKLFKAGLNGIYLSIQLNDLLLDEVALLLIGLTQIFLMNCGCFNLRL